VLKFNPTSRLLVSGSADNTVRLIAIPEGLGDTCAYCPYIVTYWSKADGLPLSLASWTYALVVLLALFIVLFAIALQFFIARGAL
jgi:prolactin regulatory element-binding protein